MVPKGEEPLEEIPFEDREDQRSCSLQVRLTHFREPVPRGSIRNKMEPKPRGTVAGLVEEPTIVEAPFQRPKPHPRLHPRSHPDAAASSTDRPGMPSGPVIKFYRAGEAPPSPGRASSVDTPSDYEPDRVPPERKEGSEPFHPQMHYVSSQVRSAEQKKDFWEVLQKMRYSVAESSR